MASTVQPDVMEVMIPASSDLTPLPVIDAPCRRQTGQRAVLEARIAALHRVASAARELVTLLYCGNTPLSDEEAALCEKVIESLHGLPKAADA